MGLILGPFELYRVLGEGGMGVVWRGLHLAQQVPVAVKVLSRRRSWELAHVESFRREAKAMARLNHPHIVHVLDCGFVDASAAKQPGSDLAEGTPYLAVELAPHGALDGLGRRLTWGEVRQVLLSVLDALAHAHARGVIHRDIKPPNVLLFDPSPGRLEVKLTDFGIAHALDEQTREGVVEESAGTPDYMAPEQFQGLWRDQGPWTDLYALGCMAYEMASGGAPFRAETFLEYAYKHIRKPPPEFIPRAGFPMGFGAWLNRAMAKDPRERFQRAADAAWALRQLGEPDEGSAPSVFSLGAPPEVRRALGLASTLDAAAPVVVPVAAPPVLRLRTLGYGESVPAPRETPQAEVRSTGTTRQAAGLDPWRGALAVSLPQRDAPPIPEDWRRALRPAPSMRLVGAGLGLYGLRSVPLLGRERERDAIWGDLREVAARQTPRLVLLRGASGVGTSRLAEWISQRAHELGAATVLQALHSQMGGPSDGVGRMLARHLGCVGLTRAQALERLRRAVVWQGLAPDEAELEAMALVELVVPGPDGGPRVKLHHPAQRYALVRRFLERLGRERPLILWLEDVQWGADALGLAEALLQDGGGPWLVLMTALDEGLARRPDEAAALARLTEGPHARELELAPLNAQERKHLVEGLLCLSGELAAQVEERCGGNPMFAVQLVGDWVRRGLLEVTPQGFALKDNHRALPDDLRRLAEERIELALASLPLAAHTTLEVAAALGLRVDGQEWDEVCRYAGAEPPHRVLGALLDHRLLEPAEDGWAFALGIVREVLEQRAKESGAWALLNLSCAYALSSALRKDPKVTPWRLGRHFFEAQEWEQAASTLGHAAQEGLRRGAFAQAWEALDLKARALERLGLEPHAARWGEVKLRQVELAEFQGRWAEAKRWAHEAAGIAQRGGHALLLAEARRRLGHIACAQGRFDEALALYGAALADHEQLEDGLGQAKALVGLGDVSRQLGRLGAARGRYVLGLARCDLAGHTKEAERVRARLLHGLGLAALQGRAFDEARGWLGQAQALDEQRGERLHAAECEVHLADLDRLEGRLDEAQARYQRALDVGVALGSGLAPHALLGMAHLCLARGWASQAQDLLAHCLDAFAHSGERDDLARAHAAMLACLAQARAWEAWDGHLLQASQTFAETQRADLDAVECLVRAEEVARAAGQVERAEGVRALRASQEGRLGAWADPALASAGQS